MKEPTMDATEDPSLSERTYEQTRRRRSVVVAVVVVVGLVVVGALHVVGVFPPGG
jgi:hypothetical protein